MTYPSKYRWPRAFWRNTEEDREDEQLPTSDVSQKGGVVTIHQIAQETSNPEEKVEDTNSFFGRQSSWFSKSPRTESEASETQGDTFFSSSVGHRASKKLSPSSWFNRSGRATDVVDDTKLTVFRRDNHPATTPEGLTYGESIHNRVGADSILSPLSPSSICPSTRVVLSRGIIEYPDVELRDTVDLTDLRDNATYPVDVATAPLLPPYPATDFGDQDTSSSAQPFHRRLLLHSSSHETDQVFTIMGRLRTGVCESKYTKHFHFSQCIS